jgi:putative RecB family exonuclease
MLKSSEYSATDGFRFHFGLAQHNVQEKTGFTTDKWLAAGFRPRQDGAWWQANGPAMVQAYIDWYNSVPDIHVWDTPDGLPAIELNLQPKFGRHTVRMGIDQVLVAGSSLVIVDLKTSARVPVDPMQLGFYASGIETVYGVRPDFGMYFMARGIRDKNKQITGYTTIPIDLSSPQYSVPFITRQLDMMDDADKSGVYLPKVQELCRMCGVNRACTAYGGSEAHLYDPDHPLNIGE